MNRVAGFINSKMIKSKIKNESHKVSINLSLKDLNLLFYHVLELCNPQSAFQSNQEEK